jgi:ubiquinone/menaquinone biosynthesis C-methylase UbiE
MLDVMDEEFWDAYTDRQPRTDQATLLRGLLKPWLPDIHSVLEVGCNRGDNLEAFTCEAVGVEPNAHAREEAEEAGFTVWAGTAHELPAPNNSFDLVFTMGVLIHIPPNMLSRSLREIHRVAGKYILAVEYDAEFPTPVDYRGVRAGIWKRQYGHEYISRFKDLLPVASGRAPELDGCKWWMFEKE